MKHFLGPKPPTTVGDIRGKKFNRWKCVGYSHCVGYRHFWHFTCKCGTTCVKHAGHIVGGRSTSCGCAHSEKLVTRNRTHGKSNTREYQIWKAMLKRCNNKNDQAYPRYGGRGITVCTRWVGTTGFHNFIKDMGNCPSEQHTIEREKNDVGYFPHNCSWKTRKEQNRNKRNNLMITAFGRTQCLAAWSEEIGAGLGALYYRIVTAKWDVERALTEAFR